MTNPLHAFMLMVLPKLARLHPKNKIPRRQEYPQLWNCWPSWTNRWSGLGYCRTNEAGAVESRINPIYKIRVWICGVLTGHEISKTEWGYGGGKFVDRNCRWCDKLIQVPKQEEDIPNPILEEPAKMLGWNTNQTGGEGNVQ